MMEFLIRTSSKMKGIDILRLDSKVYCLDFSRSR